MSYPSIVEISGGVPVAVHLNYEEDYRITREALEAAVSDRTKLLILNYPNNPTGRILREEDIPGSQRVSAGTSGCVCIIG